MSLNILIAVDLSPASDRIVQAGQRIASAMQGKVWVMYVAEAEPDFVGYDAGPEVVRSQVAKEMREEHRRVQALAERLRESGIDATAIMTRGPIVQTVLDEAGDLDIDLLIVGSHGAGALFDLLIGSVSRGILRHSDIPVLVVPVAKT